MTNETRESWEAKFDERFPVPCPPKHAVRDFIHSELSHQAKDIAEMAEGMKKPITTGDDDMTESLKNGYNTALTDLQTKIKEKYFN